jgi:signal peptidase I
MSSSSSGNGDPRAVTADGHPDHPAGRSATSAAAGSGRRADGEAASRATAVRLPQELDYRLRGLGAEPTDQVPGSPARTDRHQQQHRRGLLLVKGAVFLALAVLAVLLLQAFVVQPFAVPGDAMSPTLQAGDRILVVKWGLLEGPIRSGEILVFRPPQSLPCTVVGGRGGDLVLRVVALPGDTIWSVGDTIFVDGRPLRERGWYAPRSGQVGSTPIRSTKLAQGQYFVMADNRSDACDSRAFGPISKSSIVGEGIAIVGRHGHVFFRML